MRCCCCCCNCWLGLRSLRSRFQLWIRDYDNLQSFALLLIYFQIGCALIGSVLGAQYTGVLLVNLVISLFALVAIESGSQSLGRTYAVLLSASIFLDLFWFILFSHHIWVLPNDDHDASFVFSVKLVLVMQILGFSVRLSSSLLWIQMYRLGASYIDNAVPSREADFDLRTSFLNPATPPAAPSKALNSDEAIGGSIYDPTYYSSLFEEPPDHQLGSPSLRQNNGTLDCGSPVSELSQLKLSLCRSFEAADHHDKDTWNDGSPVSETSLLKNPSVGQSLQAVTADNAASIDHIV